MGVSQNSKAYKITLQKINGQTSETGDLHFRHGMVYGNAQDVPVYHKRLLQQAVPNVTSK